MGVFDGAADINIYNYKTRQMHTEKGVLLFDKKSVDSGAPKVLALGNECLDIYMPGDPRYELVIPICLGKIQDYMATEMLFKWMIDKFIRSENGKMKLLKRSPRALLFLHEPSSNVDLKVFNDALYMCGCRDIINMTSQTVIGNMTNEEAIWRSEETHGKIEFALEITKNEPREYARYEYKKLVADYKRWNIDLGEIKNF